MADFSSSYAVVGIDQLSGPFGAAERSMTSLGATAQRTGGLVSSAMGAIGQGVGLAAGMAGLNGIAGAMHAIGDAAIGLNSRLQQSTIGFTSMLGSAEKAGAFLQELQQFAVATPFEFPQLVTASQRMLAFGFAAQDVIPLLTAVGSTSAAMGAGAGGIDRMTNALGQMRAATVVQLGELNQLTEVGVPAFQILADATGKSTGEIKKMVSEGKIASDVFIDAFQKWAGANFGDMMEKQSHTFEGAMSTIHDSLTMAIAAGVEPFFKRLTRGADQFAQFLQTDSWKRWVAAVTDASARASDAFGGFLDEAVREASDAWGTIGQVFENDWQPDEAIDPIVNAIGEMTIAVRDQLLPVVQQTWGWIQDHSDSIKAAVIGIGVAFGTLAGTNITIGLIGGALAALLSPVTLLAAAGAALGVAWVNNWGDIQGKVQAFATWFTSTAVPVILTTGQAFADWFTTVAVPAVQQFAQWVTGTAVPALRDLADWLQPKIQQAMTWFTGTALPAIQAAGAAAWQWVTGTAIPALTEWAGWLQPKIQAAWEWLTATALPAIQAAGATAWAWVTDTAVPALQEFAAWMQPRLEAAWIWLTSTALPAIGTAAADVATQIQNLTTWFGNAAQAISSNQQIWTDLQGAWNALKDIGAELVRDVLGPLGQGLQTDATSAQGLAAGIGDITSKIEPFIRGAQQVAEALNAAERAATNAGLALRWYLQMLGIPVPDNPIPNIVPSAPGSQSTGPLPSQPPTSGFPQPPSIITPQEPIQGPPIPSGFDPNAPSPAQSAAPPAGPQATGPIPNYPAPSAKAAPTAEPTPTSATGPYSATSWEGRAYAAAVGAGHPNPLVFVEQIRQESQFDPNARSPKGAIGIAQIMPGTAKAWGVDPTDPHASLITAAQHSSAYVNQYGLAAGLAAYNAGEGAVGQYGGVPPFKETQEYIRNITNRSLARAPGPYQIIPPEHEVPAEFTGGNPISALPSPKSPGGGLIPRGVAGFEQNQQDWDSQMADANAICGPHLATLFASAVGRPPTRDEAVAVAEKMGIYSSAGRGSGILNASQFDEYATALIQQMDPGSPYSVAQTPASGAQAGQLGQESLAGGAPIVGFNTPLHYFGATGYDPATGKFHVGGTGTSISAASGGKPDMTIAEMEAYGGRITNVITLLGDFQTANAAATESVSTMGASVDTSTTSLSAIGAAIDPVVASMDTGTTSVTAMTDAIIASAAGQGIATETATAYSMGLTDQTTALEGVLAGFAATTPAAAELLTQLQAGTITTDEAAVAFAGLSTTTATATGEIGTASGVMSEKVVTDFGTMQAESLTAAGLMQAGVITDAQAMQADTTLAAETMQGDVSTAVQTMADDAVTAFGDAGSAASDLAGPLDDAATGFDDTGSAAKTAGPPVKEFGSAAGSIRPPNLSAFAGQLGEVGKQAKEAAKQLVAVAGATNLSKGANVKGLGSGGGKALGGPVAAGMGYVVGEQGPEYFVPRTSGTILPHLDLSRSPVVFGGRDGGIDYDKLAQAIVSALPDRPVNVYGAGTAEVTREVLRELRVNQSLRGPR